MFLVEASKISAQVGVHHLFRTFQLDELGERVFRTFPKQKKCEAGFALESEGARQCQLIHAGSARGCARAGLWSHPAGLREPGGLAIPLS